MTSVAEQARGPDEGTSIGPGYRARLRLEGFALAACGLVGSLVLVLADGRTTEHAASTAVQLGIVVAALAVLGPWSVRRAIAGAQPAGVVKATGEPTPLWHLPLVMLVLAGPFVLLGAWDAGLRVTGGCLLVGLAQALLLARVVAADERATRRRYVRAPGSRLLRGTRLAHVPVRFEA